MLTTACVLNSGGIYDAEWVARLKRGVERHLTLPHRFVCLTDMVPEVEAIGVEAIALPESWPGWWSKLCLWHPACGLTGPTLYFDLDSVVVGSLDAIAAYPHRFTMAHEFYRPHLLCSTAMAWSGDYSRIPNDFAKNPKTFAWAYDTLLPKEGRVGDQAFIEDCLAEWPPDTFRDLFGERSIASYKVHQCQDAPPADAAVVAFHGRPKPCDLKTGWVPEQWI
jgi:hypothetical protein